MFHAPFPVVLDANVLIPLTLCDTLLSAADEELFQLYWTEEILDEVRRNLVENIGCTEAQALRRLDFMKRAFPEALVSGHEGLIPAMRNDPKDRHVLAAAIHVGAQTLVTNNLRDFRAEHLPRSLQAQSADTFLQNLLGQAPDAMLEVLHRQAARKKQPPVSFDALLTALARSVPEFVASVRAHLP